MLYELRIYHMHPGRMEAIHGRFSGVTLELFSRHGIDVVDFWTDAEGHNTLYYVCQYKDMDDRNARWNAFASDPDWIAAKQASEVSGPIVERVETHFMSRVPYFHK